MNDKNMKVLINVIGAVESGGQVYGKRRYDAYAAPYTNSSNEHTVTLGWAQNYGNNARDLIKRIFQTDYRLPTGSVSSDIDYVRWAINIADDDRYYYAHSSDKYSFSCSTLVGKALYECGYISKDVVPADGKAIGGKVIDGALKEAGFTRYTWAKAGGLKPGDVLIVQPYHIAFHIKDGLMVAANGNSETVDKSKTAITTYKYTAYGTPQYVWRPSKVNKINYSSIEKMLNKDWVATKWNPTAEQKKMLIELISSEAGKKCQDDIFAEHMKTFIKDCEKEYTKDVKAQMMYCEIRHLGGKSPTDRIFKRLNGDYSLDAIMASLVKDQKDTSNNNQVGDAIYWSRHVKCRQFIDQYAVAESSSKQEVVTMTKTEKAIQYMEAIAKDNSHGYSQYSRWGTPDFDCSSLVITAWQTGAGVPVKTAGASYTGNMYNAFIACGFKDVTSKINLANGSGLIRGDVLLNVSHHTAMYCGGGREVEASMDEHGGIGGSPGDQTGWEIQIQNYRNYPWTHVLRYKDAEEGSATPAKGYLEKGDKGDAVKEMQKMLICLGYSCGEAGVDGSFGNGSEKALKKFQKAAGIGVDGKYGSKSKKALTDAYNKFNKDWKATGTATCTNSGINFRATASSAKKWNIFAKVGKGNRFEVDGKKSGKWVHAKLAGAGVGWIHSKYVSYDTNKSSSTTSTWKAINTATCTDNSVNVRSTASDKDSKNILGILNKGQRFEVDGQKSNGWVHVKVAGLGIGWIYGAYVKYD